MPRIAVLLEPFPLRNSLGAHAWVGERLCTMLLAEPTAGYATGEMRVVCNEPTMTYLAGRLPQARPFLLQPPAPEQAAFTAFVSDWHGTGLALWTAIQAGSPAHEPLYEALLQAIHTQYAFDVLAYWGTNETLRAVTARMGVPVLWAEYGPVRPPFPTQFCLDTIGVNGLASSRHAATLQGEAAYAAMPGLALDIPVGDISAYEATLCLPLPALQDQFTALMTLARDRTRVVLLVMQLADDANILQFGNGWTGPAMVRQALAELAGPHTAFILRPHPGEAHSYHNLAAADAVRALAAGRDDVLVYDAEGPDAYLACLSVATEIVCINSSVGFEASLLGKPVRVLGQASYMPADAAPARLDGPPTRLEDHALATLMQQHYIPEARFWTLDCWRQAAAKALPAGLAEPPAALRLPAKAAQVLGRTHDIVDGTLFVEGLGTLQPQTGPATGALDSVELRPDGQVVVSGWAADPGTGGMLAGVVVTTGEHSVWCSSLRPRPDVAAHFGNAIKLATGFVTSIALADLPSARTRPVRVFGVTASGAQGYLPQSWFFDPARDAFALAA